MAIVSDLSGNGHLAEPTVRKGRIVLPDGVTAPGTVSGEAQLYVDGADGDFKIKFGDGIVKTIVADS